MWQTVSRLLGIHRGGELRQKEVRRVYTDTFTTDEGQAVLADLSVFTNFYSANGQDLSPCERAYADGMKNVYARIHGLLTLTQTERAHLESAARAELIEKQTLDGSE